MIYNLVNWTLRQFGIEAEQIARGDNNQLYLTRWIFKKNRDSNKHYLHCFHQSDHADFHDHPWPYRSLILWGGYWEVTPEGRKWYGPGTYLSRPATWKHQVQIPEGKKCWTYVIAGPKEREWGFWCKSGWRHWTAAELALQQQGNVCA